MMADIAGALLNMVKSIVTAICNGIHLHGNFNDDLSELKKTLEELISWSQDIELRIELEARGGKIVREEVQEWLTKVQEVNADVQAILERAQGVEWYKRSYLAKLFCERKNVIIKLLGQGCFSEGLVVERASVHGILIPTENLEGEISTKKKIWEYLMGDQVGMIGVCGIGGVGKTTIVKHVNNDLLKENSFQKVIWVTVSYPLNVFELQQKITHAMYETEKLPQDRDMRSCAAALYDIMRRVRFVLILDDVWEVFSLDAVGIPRPTSQNGCKVIITTRSLAVCKDLGCEIVKVQPLSTEESLALFLDRVGHDVLKVPGVVEILKQIVWECAGLPLAVVVIAGSMRGVRDVDMWRNALMELKQDVGSVNSWDGEIYARLRFGYNSLGSLKIQHCFLYCCLFQADFKFSSKELIEGWIDEGLIDELGSRHVAYDMGYAFLNKLADKCLLDRSVDNIGEMNAFSVHDVVRDMALIRICPKLGYMVKAGLKLTEVPGQHEWEKDLKKVSLMGNKIFKIPFGLAPKCPTLSTLILSDNPLCEIPESFFEEMLGLKVLDLSSTLIEALPDSVSNLENLTALRLQSCERLKCLPSLAKLRVLKKLDLNWAGIEKVPQGIEMLMKLEYLDLFCPLLKEVPSGIVSSLPHLHYFNYS